MVFTEEYTAFTKILYLTIRYNKGWNRSEVDLKKLHYEDALKGQAQAWW